MTNALVGLRRTVVFGVLAIAALAVGHELHRRHPHLDAYRIASFACAAAVVVFGVLATRFAARELTLVAHARAAGTAVTPLRVLVQIVGYLLVVLAVLDVLQVNLDQFLVGGAVTGIVLGIAAQQALGNLFAGIVLLLARPYVAGDDVTVFAGSIVGPHRGSIADVGLLYTTLRTPDGDLKIPNSVLLTAAVRREPPRPSPG